MASRYMIIEFDDDKQAESLRAQIDAATRKGKKFRVIGLFSKPTAPYCRCGKDTTTKTQETSHRRGKKFGWYVCTICKRPSVSISGLVNLIKPRDIIDPVMFDPINTKFGPNQQMQYPLSLSMVTRHKDSE